MRIHRFLIPTDLFKEDLVIKDPKILHQWRDVLKFVVGQKVVIFNGKGEEILGKIVEFDQSKAIIAVDKHLSNLNIKSRSVTLFAAILKNNNFDLMVEKVTEVGVTKIVPIITEHTIKTSLNHVRLERIIKEASEQCGRTIVPEISSIIKFDEALKIVGKNKIFFDFCDKQFEPAKDLYSKSNDGNISFFVGPEGGWSKLEKEKAEQAECKIRSLGATVLRAETAAMVAVYMASNL